MVCLISPDPPRVLPRYTVRSTVTRLLLFDTIALSVSSVPEPGYDLAGSVFCKYSGSGESGQSPVPLDKGIPLVLKPATRVFTTLIGHGDGAFKGLEGYLIESVALLGLSPT